MRVLNKRRDGVPPGAAYVGRPTKFGNPFPVRRERDRLDVIDRYEEWLLAQPALVATVKAELQGKDLVCWCAPKPCHADVLMRIANQ